MGIQQLLRKVPTERLRSVAMGLLGLIGLACIVYGCALFCAPLAWIVAGGSLVAESIHCLRTRGAADDT
jgi:hypothetical protein